MAKAKKATKKVATPVATSDNKAAKQAASSSPAPAEKKAEKTPKKKAVPKPALETKKVCFTDQETGKRFCGEVTEVPKEKAKVGAVAPRRRRR